MSWDRDLHQFSLPGLLLCLPGVGDFFDHVPGEFWAEDDGAAVVSCPCGQEPRVGKAELEWCGCERVFFFTGGAVLVGNSPKRREKPRWKQIAERWRESGQRPS